MAKQWEFTPSEPYRWCWKQVGLHLFSMLSGSSVLCGRYQAVGWKENFVERRTPSATIQPPTQYNDRWRVVARVFGFVAWTDVESEEEAKAFADAAIHKGLMLFLGGTYARDPAC